MSAQVYLVDDDAAVRKALALLLETVGIPVKTFANPEAFLARFSTLEPGCLILDIRMPIISGLKLQEMLVSEGCDWPIIIISGHGDIEACRRAFRNGAADFLSKPVDEQDLIDAIQKSHEILLGRSQQIAEKAEAVALIASLTQRECEVLEQISQGFSTRDIAVGLGLSPRTIESHRAGIGTKLGTTSPVEMARFWREGRSVP